MRMLRQEEETEDVEVTWEDQKRICTFSTLNTRVQRYEEQLHKLEEEKDALDDLSSELELSVDEEQPVLYRIGETFVHLPLSRALKRVEHDAVPINDEISKLHDKIRESKDEMKELKITLYAKFGSAINLDE